jgi:hypothetical protein
MLGANARKSSIDLVGESDHQDCFCHGIKSACDNVYGSNAVIGSASQASRDFNSLHAMIQKVRSHADLKRVLAQIQVDLVDFYDTLALVADNATRYVYFSFCVVILILSWEGKFMAHSRADRLRRPLMELHENNSVYFSGMSSPSFLVLFI